MRGLLGPVFEAAYSRNMIYRGRDLQRNDGYTTDQFTDEALAYMDRHTGKPWFLYLGTVDTHVSWRAKQP